MVKNKFIFGELSMLSQVAYCLVAILIIQQFGQLAGSSDRQQLRMRSACFNKEVRKCSKQTVEPESKCCSFVKNFCAKDYCRLESYKACKPDVEWCKPYGVPSGLDPKWPIYKPGEGEYSKRPNFDPDSDQNADW